jgi:hypothetical protein
MYRRAFILTLLLLIPLEILAENIFSECSAVPETDRVTLNWVTKSETNIRYFSIVRSSNDINYVEIKKLAPKGPGNRYEYVDENVMFKGVSVVFYKIRALDSSGNMLEETSLRAHPNISGIYRTWGAIKAMFR